MRTVTVIVASVLLASFAFAPALVADDGPAAGKTPAPAGGPPTSIPPTSMPKDANPRRDDVPPRIDRAKQLVKELDDAVARVKATQPIDGMLLSNLLEALALARTLAKPVRLAELAVEEKKALVEEVKRELPAEAQQTGEGGPGSAWGDRMLARAFDGADLNDEETNKAKQIVGDYFKVWRDAMGDSKKQSDLKRKRDEDLEKAIGRPKARKVINNMNAMGPRGG